MFLIPYFNHEDILSNIALGHEVGHYIEEKYKIWIKINRALENRDIFDINKISHIIKEKLEETPKRSHETEKIRSIRIRIDMYDKWVKQITRWGKEILSDLIGLKIFGLAYFFALFEILYIKDPESLGDDNHPPTWIRLRYLIRQIKNDIEGHIDKIILKLDDNSRDINNIGLEIKERIRYIEENFSEKKEEMKDKLKEEALKIIESNSVEKIINTMIHIIVKAEIIEEYSYGNYSNIEEINELIDSLKEYIAPNEIVNVKTKISKPANIISIINASWFFFICKLNIHYELFDIKEAEYESKAKIHQKLNDLILKSIELSKIHYLFKEELKEK